MARLENEAARVLRESETGERAFRMVADAANVTALIKAPGLTVQFQNGNFAVDIAVSASKQELGE